MKEADFQEMMKGMQEAVAIIKNEAKPAREFVVKIPEYVDVKSLRNRLKMTQEKFSKTFGFSLAAVKKWEQGDRKPEKPIRTLLKVIEHNPDLVIAATNS